MKKELLSAAAASSAGLLFYMFRNAFHAVQKEDVYEVEAASAFRPFRLLFIADIHRRTLKSGFLTGNPDLIIIGGDLLEHGVPFERTANNLQILTELAPVVFAWGNNDREVDEQSLRKLFDDYGVTVLENDSMELFGNPRLKLVIYDHFAFLPDGLERSFAAVSEEDTVLFVSHTPHIFDYVKQTYAPDVMLSGHTHGGQIRLGRFGLYEKGKTVKADGKYRLISNGFGTTHLPLRLGAEAEYHLLTIQPKS